MVIAERFDGATTTVDRCGSTAKLRLQAVLDDSDESLN
jgi:hypothetical protein